MSISFGDDNPAGLHEVFLVFGKLWAASSHFKSDHDLHDPLILLAYHCLDLQSWTKMVGTLFFFF